VAAIVLNDENADKKKGIDRAKSKGQPDRIVYTEIHRNPESQERTETAEELPDGTASVGFLILSYDRFPVPKTLVNLFCACLDGVFHA